MSAVPAAAAEQPCWLACPVSEKRKSQPAVRGFLTKAMAKAPSAVAEAAYPTVMGPLQKRWAFTESSEGVQ